MRPKRDPDEPRKRAGPALDLRPLEAALRAELHGFEVRSRDVELSASWPGLRADCVGTDHAGRAVWVVVRDGPDDAALLWTVEAVACARASIDVEQDRPALAVLVVPRCSPRLLAALAFLPRGSFALLEMAAGGGRTEPGLVRRDPHTEAGLGASSADPLDAWPAQARTLAEGLAARMRRIDPALDRRADASGLSWRWHGDLCAALSIRDGALVGAADTGEPARPIEDEFAAEAWLEHVVRTHGLRLRRSAGPPRPMDLLARGRPLLSAEELAAFRDD